MGHIDRSLREYSVLVLRVYSYEKIKATFFPSIKFQISKYDLKELSKDEPGRVVATTNEWKTTPDGEVNNGAIGFSTNELQTEIYQLDGLKTTGLTVTSHK